jgi:hypothetical protein
MPPLDTTDGIEAEALAPLLLKPDFAHLPLAHEDFERNGDITTTVGSV